jgi:hypothetical protein
MFQVRKTVATVSSVSSVETQPRPLRELVLSIRFEQEEAYLTVAPSQNRKSPIKTSGSSTAFSYLLSS